LRFNKTQQGGGKQTGPTGVVDIHSEYQPNHPKKEKKRGDLGMSHNENWQSLFFEKSKHQRGKGEKLPAGTL